MMSWYVALLERIYRILSCRYAGKSYGRGYACHNCKNFAGPRPSLGVMMTFLDHPLYQELLSLKLAQDNFAIAGSGPLFARGWISDPSDIDVVARGSAWNAAAQLGQVTPAPYSDVHQISLFDGDLEILDGWFPECWPVDQIIDEADLICGLRFVRLDIILTTKRMLGRPERLDSSTCHRETR